MTIIKNLSVLAVIALDLWLIVASVAGLFELVSRW